MKSLFGIEAEYLQTLSELEENGGELTDELNERLNINKNELEEKLKAYHHVITMKNGEVETIDAEINRLKLLSEAKTKTVDRLKEMMLNAVKLYGNEGKTGNHSLEFDTLKLFTRNVTRVEVDMATLDEKYVNAVLPKIPWAKAIKIAESLNINPADIKLNADKTFIKDSIKLGEEVVGAELITEESSISFK